MSDSTPNLRMGDPESCTNFSPSVAQLGFCVQETNRMTRKTLTAWTSLLFWPSILTSTALPSPQLVFCSLIATFLRDLLSYTMQALTVPELIFCTAEHPRCSLSIPDSRTQSWNHNC